MAAFDLAMARWANLPGTGRPSTQALDEAQREDLALRAQVTVVEAFTWVRAFDDISRGGKDGFSRLDHYPRLKQVQLMLATRFVANKGIHVLARLSAVNSVPTIGGFARGPYSGGNQAVVFTWVGIGALPQITPNEDVALRTAFCDRWSGTPVITALREVKDWIHLW